ncbi:pyridoxamine 5'-phosphate oxidase family protein [Candidatus Leptofilum sp.]|uniref:pyridoxamine 5'-phosphate oxidase family protein n=1 Tax=Candidatus Leptofilum sp. TaxID=3241576 RepID=UPI003B591AEE
MAKFYEALSEDLQAFIAAQHMFFVATAPANGRINLSPKGLDCFRIINANQVAFMNLTGSGNETAAHLAADGRLTIMFCSFAGKPLILRLYGTGRAIHQQDAEWVDYVPLFPPAPNNRNIILMDIESVQSSCGFAVPLYDYRGDRDLLLRWAENRCEEGVQRYWVEKNQASIDGLPTYLLESK